MNSRRSFFKSLVAVAAIAFAKPLALVEPPVWAGQSEKWVAAVDLGWPENAVIPILYKRATHSCFELVGIDHKSVFCCSNKDGILERVIQ